MTSTPVIGEVLYARKLNKYLRAPDRPLYEQFHKLQAGLGLFNDQNQQKRILITSTLPNEGKSLISNYFATSLALAGKRVALVDANLQQPEVSNYLERKQEHGLIGYLEGKFDLQDIIQPSEVSMLDIISSGGQIENSVKLLSSEKLSELFSFLNQHYEYIIVDTPPVELATDAFIIGMHTDVMLYVVRHGVTPKKVLRKMDLNTSLNQVKDLQLIFNGIKGRGLIKKYFGFGYGYGREEKYSNRAYGRAS
jgi:capsular exopolysaccharide synthesis family protein